MNDYKKVMTKCSVHASINCQSKHHKNNHDPESVLNCSEEQSGEQASDEFMRNGQQMQSGLKIEPILNESRVEDENKVMGSLPLYHVKKSGKKSATQPHTSFQRFAQAHGTSKGLSKPRDPSQSKLRQSSLSKPRESSSSKKCKQLSSPAPRSSKNRADLSMRFKITNMKGNDEQGVTEYLLKFQNGCKVWFDALEVKQAEPQAVIRFYERNSTIKDVHIIE